MAVDFDEAGDHGGTLQIDGVLRHLAHDDTEGTVLLHFKITHPELEIRTEDSSISVIHKIRSFQVAGYFS